MKNKLFGAISFFALTVVGGYFAGSSSWKGVVYLTDGTILSSNNRNPAAIKRELDFSRLDGAELIKATQSRLITAARTSLEQGNIGIELGHFVTRDVEGNRRLACDATFNRLELFFEAEGIASAGEKPTMTIDGPCATSQKDISSIEPLWVPVTKILEKPATNAELKFDENVKFKFQNMNGSWPMFWKLQSVRLYKNDGEGQVAITSRELRELRKKPFLLNWLEARRQTQSPITH